MRSKRCSDCCVEKSVDSFYFRRDTQKRHSYCKSCHSVRNKVASKKYLKTVKGIKMKKKHNDMAMERLKVDSDLRERYKIYNAHYQRDYRKTVKGRELSKNADARRRSNPHFRVHSNISRQIRSFLGGKKNWISWERLVGYSHNALVQHLEKQFDDKMGWYNYGSYWHIDHIKPRSFFTKDEVKECWALGNLRPLEAITNIKKSNSWEVYPNVFLSSQR